MGQIRHYFEQGNVNGCRAHIKALWAERHKNKLFESSDAEDAVWLLNRTQGSLALQRQFWPTLLGLLTRWAFLAGRPSASGSAGAPGSQPFLVALQRWIAARLESSTLTWDVQAPALLLIAVIGCSSPADDTARNSCQATIKPLQLAYHSLHSELLAGPSADLLLDSPDAVTDLCTAAELVLERLAVKEYWQDFKSLFEALLNALGGAVSDLCARVISTEDALSVMASQNVPPLPHAQAATAAHPARTIAAVAARMVEAAASQEEAAIALAALNASCRQIGATCARAVAAAVAGYKAPSANSASASVTATASTTAASTAMLGAQHPFVAGPGLGESPSEAMATVYAVMNHMHGTSTAAAAAAVVTAGLERGILPPGHLSGHSSERQFGPTSGPGAARAGIVMPKDGWRAAAPTASPRSTIYPWVTLAVMAAAASGLLEGYIVAVRLQPLGEPQEQLLRKLKPGADQLSSTLKVAAAAAATANGASPEPSSAPAQACVGGGSRSICALNADPRFTVLSIAVGYGWSRLRAQVPLPGAQQPVLRAAEEWTAAITAGAAEGAERAARAVADGAPLGSCWHPVRGALAVLLVGSLGIGRVVKLAVAGELGASAVAELLDGHMQGPLSTNIQMLAKVVIEALRTPAATPTLILPPESRPTAALAEALLFDAMAGAQRLHLLYGGVADTEGGRTWLAALPTAAMGGLREILDRTFVCQVSVLAATYETLSGAEEANLLASASGIPLSNLRGALASAASATHASCVEAHTVRAAEARAAVAAMALGALADLQFCALQLRVHGDLVARLSTDAASAPLVALPKLLALLPCYPAYAARYGNGGLAAAPVATSRLAFLLPLCVPRAEEVDTAALRVLPYIYLLLKGAPESVVQAAHSTWAALLVGLCEKIPTASAGAGDAQHQIGAQPQRRHLVAGGGPKIGKEDVSSEERRNGSVQLAASMVPYYIERTCQEPCSIVDLEMLEWGLRQVLQALPEAHPMKAWVITRLARQLQCWGAACVENTSQDLTSSGNPELEIGNMHFQKQSTMSFDNLIKRCAHVIGNLVMAVDFTQLSQALHILTAEFRGLQALNLVLVLQQLHDAWLSCNDYSRKQMLEDWWFRALAQNRVKAKL